MLPLHHCGLRHFTLGLIQSQWRRLPLTLIGFGSGPEGPVRLQPGTFNYLQSQSDQPGNLMKNWLCLASAVGEHIFHPLDFFLLPFCFLPCYVFPCFPSLTNLSKPHTLEGEGRGVRVGFLSVVEASEPVTSTSKKYPTLINCHQINIYQCCMISREGDEQREQRQPGNPRALALGSKRQT